MIRKSMPSGTTRWVGTGFSEEIMPEQWIMLE
jgi:hypothetical protein